MVANLFENSFAMILLLIAFVVQEGLCENVTQGYLKMDARKYQTRQNRLLTFNTQENGDINMEIAFNVPFISIPVKKSIDMAHGAVANVNIGAVVLAGAIAFGFAVIIPTIVAFMSKKSFSGSSHFHSSRNADSDSWWSYMNVLEQTLTENSIDSTSCMQRMICWTVKNSSSNVNSGKSSSNDKIIDGLATNEWLNRITEGTAIQEAMQKGLQGVNCSQIYHQCKITQKNLQKLGKHILNAINMGIK